MSDAHFAAFEFETERLRMRPIEGRDEALFCGLYTDAQTMRYIGPPMAAERAARSFRKVVASWAEDPLQRAFFAVLDKTSAKALGLCAICRFDAATPRAEVGIMLVADAYGRGYAREGLGALVRLTFRKFPVQEIWVECSAKNPVVERMVASIGFELCDGQNTLATGTGPLAQRIWSIRRSSRCFNDNTNHRGEDHVERHQLS